MTQYDNRNSGALFPNDRKTKASHPDYKGSMTDASGQEFWISAWVKQGKKGEFLSLAFEKKEDAPSVWTTYTGWDKACSSTNTTTNTNCTTTQSRGTG